MGGRQPRGAVKHVPIPPSNRPRPMVQPGVQAMLDGLADWCQSCDQCHYRHDMRWLLDAYRCRTCLGQGVGVSALWVSPWHDDEALAATMEILDGPYWRGVLYAALTAALALLFLASALGVFS